MYLYLLRNLAKEGLVRSKIGILSGQNKRKNRQCNVVDSLGQKEIIINNAHSYIFAYAHKDQTKL